jgi:hypothetical protein
MQDIYSLPPSEQAERFRALFKYLDQQYMDLVAFYHLLVLPWRNQPLIDRLNGTRPRRASEPVQKLFEESSVFLIEVRAANQATSLGADDSHGGALSLFLLFSRRWRTTPCACGTRTQQCEVLDTSGGSGEKLRFCQIGTPGHPKDSCRK